MTADRSTSWDEVERAARYVFDRAPADRARALDDACGTNNELRAQVSALIEADETCGDFLDAPALTLLGNAAPSGLAEDPASHPAIDGYVISRKIGRGGMGDVYLAACAGTPSERVAVKVLRADLADPAVRTRFLHEQHLLSQLRHRNIASHVASGLTGDLPYFVMEFVEGDPITSYCDAHRLHVEGRVRLFVDVCRAVGHAHRHRIVHRDLKPSNVLVSSDAEVKLVDFGIAKWLAPNPDTIGPEAPLTRTMQRLLTPQYASPEQIRGVTIGPPSDVFSLGILLYEILTGRHPFAASTWSIGETERALLRTKPRRPSDVVTETMDVLLPSGVTTRVHPTRVATARGVAVEQLCGALRRGLDDIVLRALDKRPERRYPDGDALARDLERYLDGAPPQARRRRSPARILPWVRARIAHPVGSEPEVLARESARHARRADAAMNFLVRMFELAAPTSQGSPDVHARDMLEWAAENVDVELRDEPDARVDILTTLGRIYLELGDAGKALGVLRRATDEGRRLYGDADSRLIPALRHLGTAFQELADFVQAEQALRAALDLAREVYGERHLEVASRMNDLAIVLDRLGAPRKAKDMHEQALAIKRAHLPDDDLSVLSSLNNVAVHLQRMGHATEAQHLLRQVLAARRRRYGNDSVYVATALHNLMIAHRRRGDHAGAEPLAREALALRTRLLGADHPEVAASSFNLANVLRDLGRLEEAEDRFHQAITLTERLRGEDHPDTVGYRAGLAMLWHRKGESEAAELAVRACCTKMEAAIGSRHPQVLNVRLDLARILLDRGSAEEAGKLAEEVVEARSMHFGPDAPLVAEARSVLGRSWVAGERPAEGLALVASSIGCLEAAWAPDHAERRAARALLSRVDERD